MVLNYGLIPTHQAKPKFVCIVQYIDLFQPIFLFYKMKIILENNQKKLQFFMEIYMLVPS